MTWVPARATPRLVGLLLAAGTASAGDLNPPPGAIAPTMKPLDAIEPRVCINDLPGDADSEHRVTLPGRYVLTAGVPVRAGRSGIMIDVPPGVIGTVEIDLNGFEIVGEPGSHDGLLVIAPLMQPFGSVVIGHGRVVGMGGDGVHVGGAAEVTMLGVAVSDCGGDGVDVSNTARVVVASSSRFHGKYLVQGCTHRGLGMTNCEKVEIEGIEASENGEHGVSIENAVHVELRDVFGNNNTGDGVRFVNITVAAQNAAQRADIASIRCSGNGGDGLHLDGMGEASIVGSDLSHNGGDGIECAQRSAVTGIKMLNTATVGNQGRGTSLSLQPVGGDVVFHGCEAARNGGSGLHTEWMPGNPGAIGGGGAIRLTDSIFNGNGLDGVTFNRDRSRSVDMRIEDCSMSHNARDGLKSFFETGDIPTENQFYNMIDSLVLNNSGNGLTIEGCSTQCQGVNASSNGGDGMNIRTRLNELEARLQNIGLLACTVGNNGGDGADLDTDHLVVSQCSMSANAQCGARAVIHSGCRWEKVDNSDNISEGIRVSGGGGAGGIAGKVSMSDLSVMRNGFGASVLSGGLSLDSVSSFDLDHVVCSSNASYGFCATGTFMDGSSEDSRFCSNGGAGVFLPAAGGVPGGRFRAIGIFCDGNSSDGMFLESPTGGEVRDCTLSHNGGVGLRTISNNVIHHNTFIGNTGGPLVAPVPGNIVGPLVDEVTVGGNCNPAANYVR